jgi:GABA(A) receptor-associated protein
MMSSPVNTRKKKKKKKKKQAVLRLTLEKVSALVKKYPTRVPVHINPASNDIFTADARFNFLPEKDMPLGQFQMQIRSQIALAPQEAIFLFVENTIPSSSQTMSMIHSAFKDDIGVLNILVSKEETFG